MKIISVKNAENYWNNTGNTISSIHFECYFAQMVQRYMLLNIKLYKLQINKNTQGVYYI